MKLLVTTVLFGSILVYASSANGDQYLTQQEWDTCRDKVITSQQPGHYGAGGRGAVTDILATCGPQPVLKTKTGYALLKQQCDGIYQNTLQACSEQSACDEGVHGLYSAARSWITLLSVKAFDEQKFHDLCKQVCREKKMPDRKNFGKMICGEPIAYSEERVPQVVIDKQACPFECCRFGKWTARSAVVLYKAPNAGALGQKIEKGEMITALTSEVHSKPLQAKVTHTWKSDEDQGVHVGDTVYILHGIGEGAVALSQNGQIKKSSTDFAFELVDKTGPKAPQFVWWVNVRLQGGTEAWIKNPGEAFDGMDGCG